MATIRTSGLPANFRVKPQVQTFVDAVAKATGLDSFGTYAGHEPTADLAVDIFVPVNDPNPGVKVCAFTGAPPWGKSGAPSPDFVGRWSIDYVIFRQHIYNPEISSAWRLMPDRGGVTQNHFDHVHVSFNASAPAQQGDGFLMALSDKEQSDLAQRVKNIETFCTKLDNGQVGFEGLLGDIKTELDAIKKKLGA